jgi:hypothetical protein
MIYGIKWKWERPSHEQNIETAQISELGWGAGLQ